MVLKSTSINTDLKINPINIQNTRLLANILIYRLFKYFNRNTFSFSLILKARSFDFTPIKKVKCYFHPFCPKSTINLTY